MGGAGDESRLYAVVANCIILGLKRHRPARYGG